MARDERSFDEFTRARLPHLLMLGRTLTCDEHAAETLVEEALARVLDRWDESSPFTAEEEVRRSLVRAALRRTSVPAPTDDPVWTALAGLTTRERAALALLLHEDLSDEQAADVLDCSAVAAREAAERATAAVDVEATRLAVLEPVPLDESVMTEVRSRAARLRHRRSLVTAAVAIVAALTLGVVVLATAGGATGVKGLEYPVLALESSAPDTVWAMTRDKECPGCTVLWKGDGSGVWAQVYTFRAPVIQAQMMMAPDGRNGFAWFASNYLQATHDGGKTWVVPEIDIHGSRVEIEVVGETVYAQITGIDESRLESSTLGTDTWEEVPLSGQSDIGLFPFRGEVWVRDSSSDDDVVEPLNGQGQAVRVPCAGANVVASPHALWASCQGPLGQQVLQSTDGRTWREFATVKDAAPALFPVSDDRLLMRTFTGAVLVTADDIRVVDLGLGRQDTIASATFPSDGVGFVRSYRGVVAYTDDGGETWSTIS